MTGDRVRPNANHPLQYLSREQRVDAVHKALGTLILRVKWTPKFGPVAKRGKQVRCNAVKGAAI